MILSTSLTWFGISKIFKTFVILLFIFYVNILFLAQQYCVKLVLLFMHARYKDYVSGGLHLKKLRDPDGGVHLARKKVLMGIADEINPTITDLFPKDGYHDDLDELRIY